MSTPWQWVQPPDDAALVARLRDARDLAVPERERENLCGVAAGRIAALLSDRARLIAALTDAANKLRALGVSCDGPRLGTSKKPEWHILCEAATAEHSHRSLLRELGEDV